MALGVIIVLATIGILVCSLVVSALRKYLKMRREVDKLVGPPYLPFIGNILQVLGTPAQIFTNIRHLIKMYGPTFRAWIGIFPSVNTTSPEDTEILIASTKNSVKGPIYGLFRCWLGTGLLTSYGDKWYHRRKILTPSFHFNVLLQFVDIFNKHTVQLVESIKRLNEECCDISGIISEHTLKIICESAMGVSLGENDSRHKAYKDCIKDFGQVAVDRTMNPLLFNDYSFMLFKKSTKNREICDYLHDFSRKVISERIKEYNAEKQRSHNSDKPEEHMGKKKMAMLDVLLEAKYEHGAITDDGIREEVDTFIFEGHDTTAVSLCYSLMLLACNKECQEKVYEEICEVLIDLDKMPTYNDLTEMKYLERCIKESLRLYPSVPIISRVSEGNTTTDGYHIPEGCMANVLIYDMHRRADIYPDPEKFDPDRFLPENVNKRHPFAYIPFSAGPRNCIGQRFAMLEMKSTLIAILKHFKLEPVDTPETVYPIADLILRPESGIRIKFLTR